MNFPMIVLLCFVCCLFSCRVTKDRRTLTGIVVMGRTYKRRSKSLEATALEIIVTDTGNTALKLEVPGCKDYVALRLNRHEVKKFKEALIACGNEPMVVTLFQYKVNGKHCYILYHEPSKEDSYPKFDGAKEDELKTKCRTARNIAFVLYGFSLILYPLAWWVSVILIVAASILIYLNIPLLDDELWFDSCEFIKRPKQVKGKNSDSDIVASQASIILEEISEKYQDKGKSDKDYEQYQETSAKPTEKEPTKDSKKPETSAPINNNEPVNVKVNIHTEINPEPSEILDVLEDESEPIVPPAPKSASTPESADATKPFDAADIFEPEPELEPKPEKELVFDLPVDDDDTRDPFAEEDSDSPAGLSFDPSGVDMDDDKKDPFAEDDGNVFNPPDDVNEHEEEPGMDMMDLDVPAPPEPDIVDAPTLEQEPSMQDNAPEMPAKKTNAFGTFKAAATEPKVEPHESAKPVESHPTQPRPQKPDVPQTPKAEPKAEPVAPAQRPKADREAALAGFNITRKVEPSKEVKKPKKPITDKRTSTSKSSSKEDSAKAPKQKQPSKEAPAKSQKKPANEKQQNSDEPKKAQPFDQSFRKRGRGSSKKAQQSNGQISFEELH